MTGSLTIRPYEPGDLEGWLRCRVLSFMHSSYYDDVLVDKPRYDLPAVELVAEREGLIAGVLDITIDGREATIDTIATHPDHARQGIASQLLEEALRRLAPEVAQLDAWTREDEAANRWYQSCGFRETYRYLHVYANSYADEVEIGPAFGSGVAGLIPIKGFFHAQLKDEERMRKTYSRVHVCRQYVKPLEAGLAPSPADPPS